MRRVGIVTIIDNENYGNRLQNFALQEVLKGLGVESVETLRNSPGPESRALLARRAAIALRKRPVQTVRQNVARLRRTSVSGREEPHSAPSSRAAQLSEFTRAHISEHAEDFEHIGDLDGFAAGFDAFVVGSDQVWNPGFRRVQGIDFLTFAEPRQRIAYAASFGISELPEYLRTTYSRLLNGIPSISVREDRGAEIVRGAIGRSVPTVLDPTLLVEPQFWAKLAEAPTALVHKDYILAFMLGGYHEGERDLLEKRCRAHGLELVDFLGTPSLATSTPQEFLGSLRGAALVVTDSYHAATLSLAQETRVAIRFRHQHDARMETLYRQTGFTPDRHGAEPLWADEPNWDKVASLLAIERAASISYLTEALGRAG